MKIAHLNIHWTNQYLEMSRHLKFIPFRGDEESFVIPKSPDDLETCESGLPIPPRSLWEGYGKTKEDHLAGGEQHVNKMIEILEKSSFSLEDCSRILDFGCASGRMIRHLHQYSHQCEIWGADINSGSILWCKRHLSPAFNFCTVTTMPHLPFEDHYFDYIYAGSVFTHIDDLADTWLLELRRVLSRNGRLYITIHDNHSIHLLDTKHANTRFSEYMHSYDFYKNSKETFGMLAVNRDHISQVFYDIDFISKILSSIFNIVSITKEAYGFQTGILLEKKS